MPSRTITLTIVVFWLATVGLMVYRDRAREDNLPPPFLFDLMDEVGPPKTVQWDVLFQGKEVAVCNTSLSREPRRFRLNAMYVIEDRVWDFGKVPVRLLETSYHLTLRGELVEMKAKVSNQVDGKNPRFFMEVQADSWEADNSRKPENQGQDKPRLARLPSLRTVFNPLLPRSTLPGLYLGRTWGATVFDPLENARKEAGAGPAVLTTSWQARVAKGDFTWWDTVVPPPKKRPALQGGVRKKKDEFGKNEPVVEEPRVYPCWRVDFTDTAGALRSRIWVRQQDDWVLQQEVIYPEGTLRLVRKLDKNR